MEEGCEVVAENDHASAALFYRLSVFGRCMARQVREGRWREALEVVHKLLVLDHQDLIFDRNCRLITEIENNLTVEHVVEWVKKMAQDEAASIKDKDYLKKFLWGEEEEEELADE